MIDRDVIIRAFPATAVTRPNFHDLAKVILDRAESDRFFNVLFWTDVIDFGLEDVGGHGLGPLLSIMPADMAVAFIPAWLVIGLENAFPCDGVISALAANLDPIAANSSEEKRRFQTIYGSYSLHQREVISQTMLEIADLNFRKHPDAYAQFSTIAAYWSLERDHNR
jgi:hypothetical protein